MNRVPGNSLDSSDRRLIQTFDTEGGDFIKGRTTVLESIIRCPVCRAECLSTSPALVATTLSLPSRVETVANDGSDFTSSRGRAVLVGTAETLHGWDLGNARIDGLELSLKLYHARELHPSLPTVDCGSTLASMEVLFWFRKLMARIASSPCV
jgi:hypothetical protein